MSNRFRPIDFGELIDDRLLDEREPGSHTELDPEVFHPSSVGYSKWKLLVSKLGLDDIGAPLLRTFELGNILHEFVQDTCDEYGPAVKIEEPIKYEEDGLTWVGHADLYDAEAGVVYDIKTRSGWHNFDPPNDRHVDQLYCYMQALGADRGQVVYLSKKDMELRPWPNGTTFGFVDERWERIKDKCADVRDALREHGLPETAEEIPFERPDTYYANVTQLTFENADWRTDR